MASTFKGEILVASKIVDYLSSGLYESPAACLKELINNSYDADATRVDLFVKPDANRIIVSDNGHGMDAKDFVRNFSRISESFKRESSESTTTNRAKIGKIGIGFIAANEICDVMQIISTKRGSTEKIDVEINFAAMRSSKEDRRRESTSFAKADFVGRVSQAATAEHYTHIFLKEIRGPAQELLAGARATAGNLSLYGLSSESLVTRLRDLEIRSWEDLDFYSKTMLEVALNVPVRYADNWCPSRHSRKLSFFAETALQLNFVVNFDGTELRKPTIFPANERSLVKTFDFVGKDVSFKSYFYVQHGVLKPQDLNGVLIRIRNAGVGRYDRGFLDFPNSVGTLFQRWISAEIWADDRLEPAMNIDRKTLRITHPAYVEMVETFHVQFRQVLQRAREVLYEAPAKGQRKEKATQELKLIERSLHSYAATTAKPGAIQNDPATLEAALLKKYSASELLDIVLRVADATLSKSQKENFTSALMQRLFQK